MTTPDLDQRAIDVVRGLAMDAPNAARSGHQGTAMALAPLAHVLWTRVMTLRRGGPGLARPRPLRAVQRACVDPAVLDALPHRVRPRRSTTSRTSASGAAPRRAIPSAATPPASRSPPARSARASPTGSGMGLAERWLRTRFGADVVDHHTFVIAGDGCLEEGISHEAASLAGHLGLGRLSTSTTTTTSRSTVRPSWPSTTTR